MTFPNYKHGTKPKGLQIKKWIKYKGLQIKKMNKVQRPNTTRFWAWCSNIQASKKSRPCSIGLLPKLQAISNLRPNPKSTKKERLVRANQT